MHLCCPGNASSPMLVGPRFLRTITASRAIISPLPAPLAATFDAHQAEHVGKDVHLAIELAIGDVPCEDGTLNICANCARFFRRETQERHDVSLTGPC
jgi:hypothetical protein